MDGLIKNTMASVEAFFENETDHHPSEEIYCGLAMIPYVVDKILRGEAEPKYYVCPLDTGTGKSVTLAHTIRQVRERDPSVGVVLAVGRYTQIEGFVETLGLAPGEYAWLTSQAGDTYLEGRGLRNLPVDQAPVLLTTHSMIEAKLYFRRENYKSTSWDRAAEFFYKGKPRVLRCWDEQVRPNHEIVLNFQAIAGLAGHAKHDLVLSCRDLLRSILTANHQEVIEVEDFAAEATFNEFRRSFPGADVEHLKHLWALSGLPARVIMSGGIADAISWSPGLPGDMLPMLVLDAGARLKGSLYRRRVSSVGDTVVMRGATKKYERVLIKTLEKGGGKASFARHFEEVLDHARQVVDHYKGMRFVVLYHKADGRRVKRDFEGELLASLAPEDRKRVRFCHWGVHNSTNDFRDCDGVIVASLFWMPDSVAEAAGRAATDRPVSEDMESKERQEVLDGLLMSDLLQGLSRGSLRKCDGDQAHPCKLFVVTGSTKGRGAGRSRGRQVAAGLAAMFPGARLVRGWLSDSTKTINLATFVGGQIEEALNVIQEHDQISFKTVRDRLGGLDPGNFKRKIVDDPRFAERLASIGYCIEPARPGPGKVFVSGELHWTDSKPKGDVIKETMKGADR